MIGIEAHRDAKTQPARAGLADAKHTLDMPNASKPIGELSESDKARFFAKINRDGPTMPYMETACWVWTGAKDKKGYGRARANGKTHLSHRLSFQISNAQIPEGRLCLHRCDNPPCVNPTHLRNGTARQNTEEMMEKGRDFHAFGEEHPRAKLDRNKVLEMRGMRKSGGSILSISRKFGVAWWTAKKAIQGGTWAHIQ